jgi:ribulose 1,5-bisphosphate synthetase/thiazole synthase
LIDFSTPGPFDLHPRDDCSPVAVVVVGVSGAAAARRLVKSDISRNSSSGAGTGSSAQCRFSPILSRQSGSDLLRDSGVKASFSH